LKQSRQTRLLTTRLRTAVAFVSTALVFVLAVRGPASGHPEAGWLFPPNVVLHGWPLIAVNVFLYGYMCWLGFWFIRGTAGRERFFMVGWVADILLWPLKMLRPQWAVAIRHIGAFGLGVALLATLALLLEQSRVAESEAPTDAT
jgi:hypothetical protein